MKNPYYFYEVKMSNDRLAFAEEIAKISSRITELKWVPGVPEYSWPSWI